MPLAILPGPLPVIPRPLECVIEEIREREEAPGNVSSRKVGVCLSEDEEELNNEGTWERLGEEEVVE